MADVKRYEQVPHTADIAARVFGKDIPELFENAIFAMFDIMADLADLTPDDTEEVKIEAPDTEALLIATLNELLYMSHIKRVLPIKFHVKDLNDKSLTGEVRSYKMAPVENRMRAEIKAATYHDLNIQKTDAGFEVTIVFDV